MECKKVRTQEWVYSMCPKICRATLKNWLNIVKEHGCGALSGRYGLHRKGSGNIDSQECIKKHILKGVEEGKNSVEILECLKSELSQSSVKIPSLRRIQAWIKAHAQTRMPKKKATPVVSLQFLYEKALYLERELQSVKAQIEEIQKNGVEMLGFAAIDGHRHTD